MSMTSKSFSRFPFSDDGREILNDSQVNSDERIRQGHANWIEIRLTSDEHDRNQAARSTTSVISSCCGAPSANA